MSQVVGIAVLIALALIFEWLATRAGRSRSAVIKWPGLVLTGLLALVFALVSIVALIGVYQLNAPRGNPVSPLKASATSDQIATAERFAHGCAGCHSTAGNVPLDGSKDSLFNGSNGPPFGTMYAPNLTPCGPLKDWSDGEIIRAIREGVDQNGRPLVFMPSDTFHDIGDADVQALVAYLRSQPAVQHDTPPRDISILGTILIGAGLFPTAAQPPITQPIVAPPPGPTPAYGEYLVNITGCRTCHGQNLTGRPPGGFGPPAGPTLVAVVPTWSEADFVKTIRTGVNPKGHALNPDQMPWKDFSAVFTDDNLKAIYAYLHDLKPK